MVPGVTTCRLVKRLLDRIVDPLRADDTVTHFTLAIPEAQTTTVDSVQGWENRPPAVLRCAGCDTEISQPSATSTIDCPYCYREFPPDEFGDLVLVELVCPRCDLAMNHGIRHPMLFDTPEWATCRNCQYHWDLNHWF